METNIPSSINQTVIPQDDKPQWVSASLVVKRGAIKYTKLSSHLRSCK